jgi:hypothetical protein
VPADRRAAAGRSLFLYTENEAAADPVGLDEAHQHFRA